MISVIITSFNEGGSLATTVGSVWRNTSDCEIIVVDDGSTDGSCDFDGPHRIVRHEARIGIAQSRLDGVAAATGDCLVFLDAHQSVSEGCFNTLAAVALDLQAITVPCTRGPVDRPLRDGVWTGHGCRLKQQSNGLFVGGWKNHTPRDPISRCTMMIVPGYCIPRSIFSLVRWNDGMYGWGGSEPNIFVKAWAADVDILHVCGPLARHKFRDKIRDAKGNTKSIVRPFHCSFAVTWKNHAMTSRIVFDTRTWRDYWWPNVYRKWDKDGKAGEVFETDDVLRQHQEFQQYKKRSDEEFWRGVAHVSPYPDYSR